MSALAASVLAVTAGVVGMMLADVVSRELRARLDKLPEVVVQCAAKRVPEPLRAELRSEWLAELAEILRGREALPVTRLWIGTRYAFGLLCSGRTIGRTLSPNPIGDPLSALLSDGSYSEADRDMLRRAYKSAAQWHRGQWRRSGDPYVTHSVAVARILAGLGMDAACVCAGLLHDLPSRPGFREDTLVSDFGGDIAAIIRGVTALDSLREPSSVEAALESTGRDVLAVKLADRLHNMQTIDFMGTETQRRKSRETLVHFVPLAGRLGFEGVRTELEDLAIAALVRTA